jgi:hypothetical protein
MRLLKRYILTMTIILMNIAPVMFAVPATTYAEDTLQSTACEQLNNTFSNPDQECGTKGHAVLRVVHKAVNLLSIIAGAVGVIMIIVGGLRYITSAGDSNKASAARSTLIYAAIGIAVAALAQFLVHFVLNASDKAIS